ncbi:MAG: hypothetical protein NVSMB62_28610 [Acidobacteriaceae bacterium]
MMEAAKHAFDRETLKCGDEAPDFARIAARQDLVTKRLKPTMMLPFIVFLLIDLKFFKDSNNWIVVSIGMLTVLWAGAVNFYSLYLRITVHCPKCGNRFGSGDKCASCSLPRHAPSTMFQPIGT